MGLVGNRRNFDCFPCRVAFGERLCRLRNEITTRYGAILANSHVFMSRRTLKAGEAIREVIGMSVLTDLQAPRIRDVTVTRVEVSADMRHAKVYVSVMGDEAKQELCLRGLRSAAGFLQSKIAKRIDTRYTPQVHFVLDQGVKHSLLISQMLDKVLPPKEDEEKGEGRGGKEEEEESPDEPQ